MSTQLLAEDMVDVLGVRFHRVTMGQTVEKILYWVQDGSHHMVVTAGPEFVMQCLADESLQELVNSADLVTADGIGVVWAAARTGRPVPERVTGVELVVSLLQEANVRRQPLRVFILGAAQASLEACLDALRVRFPEIEFAGRNGYFNAQEVDDVVAQVRDFAPNLFLVGMGQPRQERFIRDVLGRLQPCVAIGVGGSIDVWGGTVTRAPAIFRRLNVEWFYRLATQPSRLRRQMALPRFAVTVMRGGPRGRKR
ncbi:WecB/TagA/CpsF family glycosyltransferase [Alicyclobacillus fastidiosus]|uniref:WecB/TagA/CpsF family glycosyltransferase n=1 Tax=Alicyclobacillus fastidiosus TaxID=392011 RepID=A0ABY6ZIH4_9BACL|nr:WecB/TagA/CpsF family glycosyltransferase [Alicyclobacillus fastidiosus]WAH42631.1 WecB/TagA/CpsF family glycosyltransferase [Alicyclobacillus fastidiosus]GMA64503.1 acetylglucosaminyldiphosphoundecaprenol acetyl-beta-D-mannosaminyltransferase [Alicyclobacillus fastidiosus]